MSDRFRASFAIARTHSPARVGESFVAVLMQLRARIPILTMGLRSGTSADCVQRTLMESIGEQQASRVPVRALKDLLDNVETVASANKSLSWHVHLSGYGETGKVSGFLCGRTWLFFRPLPGASSVWSTGSSRAVPA